jgi:hypothetical protein
MYCKYLQAFTDFWQHVIVTLTIHSNLIGRISITIKAYLRKNFLHSIFLKQKILWLVFAYLLKVLGIIFLEFTRYQFKLTIQYTDEICQWYWYGSELFGIKVSSEWIVDGNYF